MCLIISDGLYIASSTTGGEYLGLNCHLIDNET